MQFGSCNEMVFFSAVKAEDSITVSGESEVFFGYEVNGSPPGGVWARWNYANGKFSFKNDQFGIFPIYYFSDSKKFVISNSLIKIIEILGPQEIDDIAISVFIRTGFYIENDTPFLNIKVPPPGCSLTWESGVLSIRSSTIEYDKCSISRFDAVGKYGSFFQENFQKYLPNSSHKVGLPLSGGRDSRHLLFAFIREGIRPTKCITMKHFPPKSNEDLFIAIKICKEFELEHAVLEPHKDPFSAEVKKNIITNFSANQHAWLLPLSEYIQEESFEIVYDGIAGDVLSTTVFSSIEKNELFKQGKMQDLANLILGEEGYLSKSLSPHYYMKWNRTLAVKRIVSDLEKYALAPNPISQFYFWNKTRRQTSLASWRILNRNNHVVAPFLDVEVFRFLSSIPYQFIFEGECFHSEAITRYYPEFSNIPFENKVSPKRTSSCVENIKFAYSCFLMFNEYKKSSPVKKDFIFPRLMKGMINKKYGTELKNILNIPVYLKSIEKFTNSFD